MQSVLASESLPEHGRCKILTSIPAAKVTFASTPVATLMTLTNIYLHYLFAPWFGIERWVDVYAVAESWMRIILLAGIAVNTPDILRERKGGVIFIFLLYLGLTALWAVGTTNYGQGIRHHVLTNWMLVMVAVASIPSLPKAADRR